MTRDGGTQITPRYWVVVAGREVRVPRFVWSHWLSIFRNGTTVTDEIQTSMWKLPDA